MEVAFRGNRKEFFLWDYPDPPAIKAGVIVDADRGEDLGFVHSLGDLAQKRSGGCAHGCGTASPTRKALRLATAKDTALARDLERQNDEVRRKAMERVRTNGLAMKLSDAEWQWDRKKLTFYFTAEKRVDFRSLVRDLATLFRTRIELKQIGVRDEARRLDGVGRCGRQFCSAAWLPELRPVNLGVAKDQRLSLNPSQISGACGRLMCSLRYEHDFYVQARRRFPKEGRSVTTARGEELVVANDIFGERITLRGVDGETRVIRLIEFQQEMSGRTDEIPLPHRLDDEGVEDHADEISPELLYTAEHAVPLQPFQIFSETAELALPEIAAVPGDADAPGQESGETGDSSQVKRRRGRRGGRRGKGRDGSSGNQS